MIFSNKNYENRHLYANLADSVDYMGGEVCKNCHYDKYKTFAHTGMGKSFGIANKSKSAANIHPDSILYDSYSNFYYYPYWNDDDLILDEFRIKKNDTIHKRSEKIHYIIGSGQHTNSHIYDVNGYLHQAPFTYYTQDQRFDLPPGYENGLNTRFNRKIGLECMSCHNSLPDFVIGSENKFNKVHFGISCERCHGPGEIHVKEKIQGNIVDTSLYIDYTIVNPGKLSAELQFDICSRCHLQGNTVLEDGASFYDFKPGMHLDEVMNVFLPRYKDTDDFIMASHVDRLKMSECFKESDGKLTCITCHNPHVSVEVTNKKVFNTYCSSCHNKKTPHIVENENCINCHMPKSGSIDIPHVRVTDHKISVPKVNLSEQNQKLKEFIGLYCINNENPSELTILRAYLQQFEKFEQENYYLDSALTYLNLVSEDLCLREWIKYYFFKSDFKSLVDWFEKVDFSMRIKQLSEVSYSNDDAWAMYRVGEAYYKLSQFDWARKCFEHAVSLAPFHLEIQNKYGMVLLKTDFFMESKKVFEFILSENPNFEKTYANYGYLLSLLGQDELAVEQYRKALSLNPDILYAWLNYAAYHLKFQNWEEAIKCLNEVIRINPNHSKAKQLLKQLK